MTTLGQVFQWMLLFVGLYVVVAAGAWIASALRFALANPIRKQPGDRIQKFQFQIGTAF